MSFRDYVFDSGWRQCSDINVLEEQTERMPGEFQAKLDELDVADGKLGGR